jgi:hypothetical protein
MEENNETESSLKESPVDSSQESPVDSSQESPVESSQESPVESLQESPVESLQESPVTEENNGQDIVKNEKDISTDNVSISIVEKYPDGIYTDKIEFSELLNARDNAIIRQIKVKPVPIPIPISSQKNIIPKKIFQTHKSIDFVRNTSKLRLAMNSWRKHSKEFEYYFYTDEICDKFMQENYEGPIYEAYKKLPLGVMKADLWRYCIIYKYGGIYADIDTICYVNPSYLLRNAQIVCAPESDENYLCQWTFAAPPESPALKCIIDLAVERINKVTKFVGKDIVHFLTGPQVFTEGIEKFLIGHSLKLFRSKTNYVKYSGKIPHIFVFDKNLFHKKMIKHLFAGYDTNGWKRQRDALISQNIKVGP